MMHRIFLVACCVLSNLSYSLEGMSDDELSESTGEGIGVIVDNLSLHSGDYGSDDDFVIRLDLDGDNPGTQQFLLSELRLHKTGTLSGSENSGGSFGNVNNPVFLGDLQSVDIFTGDAARTSGDISRKKTTTTVMRSEFPGANIRQINRKSSFQKNSPTQYQALDNQFNTALDAVAEDKFSLHWRFDDIIRTINPNAAPNFRAQVDFKGFRFYGTQTDILSLENKGFSLVGSTGIQIDQISISAEANSNPESQITLNGIDIFTTLGSVDQPLTIGSAVDSNGKSQLVLEIAPLPASKGIVETKSNIYIKSLYFGDKHNPEMRTGIKDASKDVNDPERYHYAFQPDVGNTIEITGMAIQYLRVTTLDI